MRQLHEAIGPRNEGQFRAAPSSAPASCPPRPSSLLFQHGFSGNGLRPVCVNILSRWENIPGELVLSGRAYNACRLSTLLADRIRTKGHGECWHSDWNQVQRWDSARR